MPETDLDEFVEGMGDELSEDQHRALRNITREVSVPDEVTTALSAEDQGILDHCEAIIIKNFQAFVEVGTALRTIRDRKLYVGTHLTFESYCRDKFEIARTTAYQKIEAAETARQLIDHETNSTVDGQDVRNCGHEDSSPPEAKILPNEAQARKLAELPAEDRPDAWRKAVQRGIERHGRVTAKTVAEVVAEALGKRTEDAISKAKSAAKPGKKDGKPEFVDPSFTKALQALLDEISAARIRNWYGVPKSSVLKALRVVLQAIEAE